ncbi:MAG: PilZ domain-containing protein [Pyrinomonadaceae bacterium]|nr:PilZ domain-containing protein [Pyrinomonadaceae bacterium]
MNRKYTRLGVALEIYMDFTSGRREARVSDLSMGGCFVDSIAAVSQGEKIGFELKLSPRESLRMKGEVAYVMAGIGFGIRFEDVSEFERDLIAKTIKANGGIPDMLPE